MGFSRIFHRRKSPQPDLKAKHYHHDNSIRPPAYDVSAKLPPAVLTRILTYVCPHAADESYETSEESMTEDGCMLCDMRDLAHCALVGKRWYSEAERLLYADHQFGFNEC